MDLTNIESVGAKQCVVSKHYGVLAPNGKAYFLTRLAKKWHWLSSGSDRNFATNIDDFNEALKKASEVSGNKVFQFDSHADLFLFLGDPEYHV